MATGASFLVIANPRGDLDFVSRSLELAARKDVGAQAVFFLGDIAGPILTSDEETELRASRQILGKELGDRHDYYEGLQVRDLLQLGHFMSQNAANYRRGGENNALRSLRSLVGLRDVHGKWVESGRALLRARRVYNDAERLFKKSPVAAYVMADTLLCEELIDASRWLHFAWISLGGVAIRALCVTSGDLPHAVPELAPGARRGGKPVGLSEYPLASGDVIFSIQINPALHEVLSTTSGKLAVILGDGRVDRTYEGAIVATQRDEHAYLYKLDARRVTRRAYPYKGGFGEPLKDDIAEALAAPTTEQTMVRRRELEEKAKLAGLGSDLVHFLDFMRAQNPALAREIERSNDRVEVILKYIRELEESSSRMADLLSTQRAGMERLVKALDRFVGEEAMSELLQLLNVSPELQHDVATWDGVNAKVAEIVVRALEARSGEVPARGDGSPS